MNSRSNQFWDWKLTSRWLTWSWTRLSRRVLTLILRTVKQRSSHLSSQISQVSWCSPRKCQLSQCPSSRLVLGSNSSRLGHLCIISLNQSTSNSSRVQLDREVTHLHNNSWPINRCQSKPLSQLPLSRWLNRPSPSVNSPQVSSSHNPQPSNLKPNNC